MSLFDGINASEQGMNVASFRSQVTANNMANIFTPGYQWQKVNLAEGGFGEALRAAGGGRYPGAPAAGAAAASGAVRVSSLNKRPVSSDYRSQAMEGIVEMYQSKNAFELNMRAATMMKSMALSSLEIGRGS